MAFFCYCLSLCDLWCAPLVLNLVSILRAAGYWDAVLNVNKKLEFKMFLDTFFCNGFCFQLTEAKHLFFSELMKGKCYY